MQRKNYGQRRIGMIVASVVGLFLIIVVPITGFFYTKNGIKNLDQSFATNKYLNDFDDGLVIKGIITQIDPINSYFKTQFTFVPIGSFRLSFSNFIVLIESTVMLILQLKIVTILHISTRIPIYLLPVLGLFPFRI